MTYFDLENYIEIIRGTSKIIELAIEDDDGSPINLTGGQIYFTVKKDTDAVEPLIQKSSSLVTEVEFTDPKGGVARIYLYPGDTYRLELRKYTFDIWFINAAGARYAVIPPSTIEVLPGVTRLAL